MSTEKQKPEQTTSASDVSRRDFIRATTLAAAAVTTGAATAQNSIAKNILPATILGANAKIRTGHIGVGQMGKRDLQFALMQDELQPIAVCDLIEKNRGQAADMVENKYARPTIHERLEDIIENKDVDAVVIVTPDHWHTIPGILACEAGKDVWCEKPLTTSILEGQPIIDAVRKNKRVFQCGNFQRSGLHFQEAVKMVRDGYIGKVARVETWIHDSERPEGMGVPPPMDPPPGFDWLRYQGWTQRTAYDPTRVEYNFRWYLDYSGGKMTDWGAHLIDIVLWAMGEDNPPREVMGFGEKYVLTDGRTTPDTCEVLYRFDNYVLSFSNRVWNGVVSPNRYGIKFHGTLGSLYIDRMGYEVTPIKDFCEAKKVSDVKEGDMNVAHWRNWIECLQSRKDPICFVESAFNTAKVCHMGTASYVAGGRLKWNNETNKFEGEDTAAAKRANEFAYRPYQNGYALKTPYIPTA